MRDQWKFMTDTDTDALQTTGWKILPQNVIPVAVAPPSARIDFRPATEETTIYAGWVELIGPSEIRRIAPDTHNALLNESLQEYGDIWRRLALR